MTASRADALRLVEALCRLAEKRPEDTDLWWRVKAMPDDPPPGVMAVPSDVQ